ncbi:DUF998 domain-containing protein [Hoyosella subflava]|uniref:DUF998 domain-containing protein n=1 Tax=Hoyosella subflava (strain DSM 45089 / JCM 17490 / NBRC 109087 / DQS3-9A1) TaxID=443218 RepID=F6EGT3_HOYSD|nr:DUF998 domain-containing protein [Hoyosella subflava]AEF42321.1 hypothetical protein AS9A_3883 [Hoyosella subflava DQS3-9A1]
MGVIPAFPATVLTAIGAVGTVGFAVVFLVDGWTRTGYRWLRHPVSALALGDRGWVQTTNFAVSGAMIAAGGVGALGVSVLLGGSITLLGLALIASGIFPMDAMRGYPPGTTDTTPTTFTRRHLWHDRAGAVVFLLLPVLPAIAAVTADFGWAVRTYSALTSVLAVVLVHRFTTAWESDAPRTGLWQRAALILVLSWLAAVCVAVGRNLVCASKTTGLQRTE